MTAATPKAAEFWSVTLCGEIWNVHEDLRLVTLKVPADSPSGHIMLTLSYAEHDWELLPDPEPEYLTGVPYIDAVGDVWSLVTSRNGWKGLGMAHWAPLDEPRRPLTRLIPEVRS